MSGHLVPGVGFIEFSHSAGDLLPGGGFVEDSATGPALATALLITGPSGGMAGYPSDAYAVTLNGALPQGQSLTVTIGVAGGATPSAATLTLTNAALGANFHITPTDAGTKTITLTNDSAGGSIANPAALTYEATPQVFAPTVSITSVVIEGDDVTLNFALGNEPTSGSASLTATSGGVSKPPQPITITGATGTVKFLDCVPGTYFGAVTVSNQIDSAHASTPSNIVIGEISGDIPANGSGTTGVVSTSLDVAFAVRNSVTANLSVGFGVRNFVATGFPVDFAVRGFVAANLPVSFGVRAFVSRSLPVPFGILAFTASELSVDFAVRNHVTTSLPISFAVRNFTSSALPVSYGIRQYVSRSLFVSFAVGGSAAPAVVFPPENAVMAGEKYGPTGVEFTGTYVPVFPPANKVVAGEMYGPTGNEFTGVFVSPVVSPGTGTTPGTTVSCPTVTQIADAVWQHPLAATVPHVVSCPTAAQIANAVWQHQLALNIPNFVSLTETPA